MLLNPQPGEAIERTQGLAAPRSSRTGARLIQTLTRYQGPRPRDIAGGEMRYRTRGIRSSPTRSARGTASSDADFESGAAARRPVRRGRARRGAGEQPATRRCCWSRPTACSRPAARCSSCRSPRRARAADFRPDRLTWFDPLTLQSALHQADFRGIVVETRAGGDGGTVRGRCRCRRSTHAVGLVPAYNEAGDRRPAAGRACWSGGCRGWSFEVVVVESNSTDGTRDVVRRYAHHPRVRLVLEEPPPRQGPRRPRRRWSTRPATTS